MGLDMYLTGNKYLHQFGKNAMPEIMEDGYRLGSKQIELGYWRKHPDLHGFIVEQFAGGVDECQEIELGGSIKRLNTKREVIQWI